MIPNSGYISKEFRKRVYELQCEYRRRDPEFDENIKIKLKKFNYYSSEEQKERWHDVLSYFEKISIFYKIRAQEEKIRNYRNTLKKLAERKFINNIIFSDLKKYLK